MRARYDKLAKVADSQCPHFSMVTFEFLNQLELQGRQRQLIYSSLTRD